MHADRRQVPEPGSHTPRPRARRMLPRWTSDRVWLAGMALALLAGLHPARAEVEGGVIRLKPAEVEPEAVAEPEQLAIAEPRKGFEYGAFEARLQSMWFQRKTFLSNGRQDDAAQQLEQIRTLCAEEGVKRVESLAGALLAEARRYLQEGHHEQALSSLQFAAAFDPGNPQIQRARAVVIWQSGQGSLSAARELLAAFRSALVRSLVDLSLLYQLVFVAALAIVACLIVFTLLMVLRYQAQFRHEIEEWIPSIETHWASALGWALLGLPLLLWFGAGWAILYWIVVVFRFMTWGERLISVSLLLAGALLAPAHRAGVALYGATADPALRTAIASADGSYDPDRIVKLRQLVYAHPGDAVYRFLLAGLYKNGRYFEEAFADYQETLRLDPGLEAAQINIGNIFYATGQYAEAVNYYRRALELNPRSVLAYFNIHLAQSEAFRFTDAEEALERARDIDPQRVTELLSDQGEGSRATVHDATLGLESIWKATLSGRSLVYSTSSEEQQAATLGASLAGLLRPDTIGFLLTPFACVAAILFGRGRRPAGRCVRCGRPFCQYCRSEREVREYCSQCLHLFVLADGLAARSKSRKLYEVERHERRTRIGRRLASMLCPGAGQLLKGRTGRGTVLILLWFAALIAWQPGALVPVERFAGVELHLDLLHPPSVPAFFPLRPCGMLGLLSLPLIWCLGNGLRWRRRAA